MRKTLFFAFMCLALAGGCSKNKIPAGDVILDGPAKRFSFTVVLTQDQKDTRLRGILHVIPDEKWRIDLNATFGITAGTALWNGETWTLHIPSEDIVLKGTRLPLRIPTEKGYLPLDLDILPYTSKTAYENPNCYSGPLEPCLFNIRGLSALAYYQQSQLYPDSIVFPIYSFLSKAKFSSVLSEQAPYPETSVLTYSDQSMVTITIQNFRTLADNRPQLWELRYPEDVRILTID
jgi:hypothetical protein